jgi:hypothetical protein
MGAKAHILLLRASSEVSEVSDASIVASHQHVRQNAGPLDVEHMVQSQYVGAVYCPCPFYSNKRTFSFRGATATDSLEWLIPSWLSTLEHYPYSSTSKADSSTI